MTEAQDYQRYPLTMAHPHFKAATSTGVPGTEKRDPQGNIIGYLSYQGTPVKFPPITVTSEQEEEYEKSQGYEPAGKVDPSAWVRQHADSPPIDYVPQKYPMYRDGVLYKTAEEDPEASEEDLAPPVQETTSTAPAVVEDPRVANMQATIDALQKQMLELLDAQRKAAEPLAHRQKRRGRPPKVAA